MESPDDFEFRPRFEVPASLDNFASVVQYCLRVYRE